MSTVQAQWLTLFFLAAVTALIVTYDVLVIRAYGPDASISRVLARLLEMPSAFVVFVFWLGVLVGHVWLPAQ
jgi:acid phosphatase family membrane protein YuiD